jgi:hypothetical protein
VGFGALERMISRFAGGEEARRWLVERTNKPYAQRWLCREQSHKLDTSEELRRAWDKCCRNIEERLER